MPHGPHSLKSDATSIAKSKASKPHINLSDIVFQEPQNNNHTASKVLLKNNQSEYFFKPTPIAVENSDKNRLKYYRGSRPEHFVGVEVMMSDIQRLLMGQRQGACHTVLDEDGVRRGILSEAIPSFNPLCALSGVGFFLSNSAPDESKMALLTCLKSLAFQTYDTWLDDVHNLRHEMTRIFNTQIITQDYDLNPMNYSLNDAQFPVKIDAGWAGFDQIVPSEIRFNGQKIHTLIDQHLEGSGIKVICKTFLNEYIDTLKISWLERKTLKYCLGAYLDELNSANLYGFMMEAFAQFFDDDDEVLERLGTSIVILKNTCAELESTYQSEKETLGEQDKTVLALLQKSKDARDALEQIKCLERLVIKHFEIQANHAEHLDILQSSSQQMSRVDLARTLRDYSGKQSGLRQELLQLSFEFFSVFCKSHVNLGPYIYQNQDLYQKGLLKLTENLFGRFRETLGIMGDYLLSPNSLMAFLGDETHGFDKAAALAVKERCIKTIDASSPQAYLEMNALADVIKDIMHFKNNEPGIFAMSVLSNWIEDSALGYESKTEPSMHQASFFETATIFILMPKDFITKLAWHAFPPVGNRTCYAERREMKDYIERRQEHYRENLIANPTYLSYIDQHAEKMRDMIATSVEAFVAGSEQYASLNLSHKMLLRFDAILSLQSNNTMKMAL